MDIAADHYEDMGGGLDVDLAAGLAVRLGHGRGYGRGK